MAIELGMKAVVVADGTVAAITTRMYPTPAPDSAALPYITYQRISTIPVQSLTAASSLFHTRMQINCWAATLSQAHSLADAVRGLLDYYSGTWDSTAVKCMFEDQSQDQYVEGLEQRDRYGVRQDYLIWEG